MEKIKPRTLSGFMELLPKNQINMERIIKILRETYELYGFYPLDTPILESSEILLAKGGGETEKQIYRFQKGDTDLSMRFDLTVPLAKYVALNSGKLNFPFRRYQIGKVYRGERAQRGRFREFYQADIDIIGDEKLDIINEAEIPSIIYKIFSKMGLEKFKIRINNRKILNGFFEMLDINEKSSDIMRIIDKMEKIGKQNVEKMLLEDCNISQNIASEIIKFITVSGQTKDILDFLCEYKGKNDILDNGINELEIVSTYMEQFGVPKSHFEIDLTIARGLDYYTGTVYETTMTDHLEIGSICSGGRYDNLAEYYTDKKLPGVGISIGLTRLFFVLEDKNYLTCSCAPADVMILPMTDNIEYAINLATKLRDNNIKVQINCESKKFKSKITYADKLSIPYVIFIGEDEINNNTISLKELATGNQINSNFDDILNNIKTGILKYKNEKVIIEN